MEKKHVLALTGACLAVILVAGAFVSAAASSRQMVLPATVLATASPPKNALPATGAPDISLYNGLGSWVDIFEKAYQHPASTVAAMKQHGVATIYIETSNYTRPDIVYPTKLGQFIDDAHAAGINIQGWYLPSFANPKKDLRKSTAAIDFTSPLGDHLDSFGLDIESGLVQDTKLRSQRLLALSHDIRTAAGPSYPLAAITPIPNRLVLPHSYWKHFPYAALAKVYDVFQPMDYLSFDTSGQMQAQRYTARGIQLIRAGSGDPDEPIHVIGGIASSMTAAETRGFLNAVHAGDAIGASLYNFTATDGADWRVMGQL